MTPFHGTIFHHFSRMRSKVRFAFHSSLDVAQPFAAVRNRPQPFAWGRYSRASGEGCKSGHFWRFQTLHNSVSCGRRGTSWHANMFHNVSKVVLCDRRNTFASFSEDSLHFSWQVQHFGDIRVHFASQLHHFRRVAFFLIFIFCESHCQGCVKWWQRANRVAAVGHESVIWRGKCSIWWRSVVCGLSFCEAGAVFGTLCTLHFTLNTVHFTLYIHLPLPLYTLHSTLLTLHFTLYTPHYTLYL